MVCTYRLISCQTRTGQDHTGGTRLFYLQHTHHQMSKLKICPFSFMLQYLLRNFNYWMQGNVHRILFFGSFDDKFITVGKLLSTNKFS